MGKARRKINTIILCQCPLPQGYLSSFSFKTILSMSTGSSLGIEIPWLSALVIQVRFLFTWPKTLLLIQIKWELIRLFLYVSSWDTKINEPTLWVSLSQIILSATLTVLYMMVTLATLSLAIKCHHLVLANSENSSIFCFSRLTLGTTISTVSQDSPKKQNQ